MLSLLSCVIYILVLHLSGINARAVDARVASFPTSNVSSIVSQTITASSQSCTDIKTCRTLEQIVVSCLATILACVWLAVHPNVPAPNREAVLVFGLAFFAPEWILAWAVRQALYARTLCKRLDLILISDAGWGMPHAFFIGMGGFCFYNENGAVHPLSPANVVELVERGHLVSPTVEEILDWSKGDALSKGCAILQTLWFVTQCITRHAEDLPITSLDIMTLAYTLMTVAMYAAWWAKPLNVTCAIRVPEEEVEKDAVREYNSIWE
ncbi:hypothetical protein FIBSPDRAFT_830876 [Athelia psychrophila]|uniref:Uncharacterized protein n=1 Tax=Athelia psychrophila TaxID=1759441 RepID=A0A166FW25_9AGAM|nr:hypothetical protein FIBSPDRAFT_830876 [Fibularhizoctonia sp. CBS 109695]